VTGDLVYGRRAVREALRGGRQVLEVWATERAVKAEAWLDAWDTTTLGLVDFRRASDFWRLGYEYALEEYRLGFDPPVLEGASRDAAVTTDRHADAEAANATAGVIRP